VKNYQHRAASGGEGIVLGPSPTSYRDGNYKNNCISKGLMFKTLVEFKQWIKDFLVKYHRPYTVLHSDVKKRYTVKCEEDGCPWIVRARLIALVVMMKMTDQLGTPRARYDEHNSKLPSVRNQGFIVQEKVNTPEGDAC
jgi:hypothetical protein